MLAQAHLRTLRAFEIDRVLDRLSPPRGRLLEIGAGDGFQAALLARSFAAVEAIDLAESIPSENAAFPVRAYDGHRLPFADRSFDVVFSSNVLEHIAHVEALQREIRRVLRPGGRAFHVLPSPVWRFWTMATHYLDLPVRVVALLWRGDKSAAETDGSRKSTAKRSAMGRWRERLINALIERRHGERGTMLSELYLFSRLAWTQLFERAGFRVEVAIPLGLFYTGYALIGSRLGIERRQALSRLLGSATVLYVLCDRECR